MNWTIPNTPTEKETLNGMVLAGRHYETPFQRVMGRIFQILVGMSFTFGGFMIADLVLKPFGLSGSAPFAVYLAIALVFAYGMITYSRFLRRYSALAYIDSPMLVGQRICLSEEGVLLDNGRSVSKTVWADVISIEEGKEVTVLTLGNTAFILPHRLLSAVGDVASIKTQMKTWHASALRENQ